MFNWLKGRIAERRTPHETSLVATPEQDSLSPDDASNASIQYKKMGDLYLEQGKFAEAVEAYQQAIALNPEYAEACNNLGNACIELNVLDKAEQYLTLAIAIKPDQANSYYNLASIFLMQNNISKAIIHLSKTLEYAPSHYAALAILLFQSQKICQWEHIEPYIATLREAVAQTAESNINIFSPFAFISLPGTTPAEQKKCAERWIKFEAPPLPPIHSNFSLADKRDSSDKISIGYISADFRQHPVSLLMSEVIELHDRERFNIIAYSYGPNDLSPIRKRLEKAFDLFVDFQNVTDEVAAQRIYSDKIDILVDLTGHTLNSRIGIFAYRPAPIQVNYLGYPGTMGAGYMDYIIADNFTIPYGDQEYYTEKVIRVPDCFMPHDSTRPCPVQPSRNDCGLPDGAFVFCNFNNSYKITHEVFTIWCRLLHAVPNSILWLAASNPQAERNLLNSAEKQGLNSERIIYAGKLPQIEEHLARMQCADLFLDTNPYNAHSTCSDALWMGLPVLTCVGDTFPSRVAGSLLTAIEIPELITYNLEDYYNLALELATNRDKLAIIRNKIIANRDNSPLFDSKRFTRNLEAAYIKMISDHSSGKPRLAVSNN